MALGIDYSLARPGGAAIKAAGYEFVCRYLASYAPKRLTADERDNLHANGLSIAVVFEDYANPRQNLNGDATATGVRDAQLALSQANGLGVPSDRPIYFAVDYDAPESDQPWIDAYLKACASVLGTNRVGIYGGFYVVKRCAGNGSAKWFWQTVAWSGGQQFVGNHIYQNGQSTFGGGADIDESKQNDFGQWPIGGGDMPTIVNPDILEDLSVGLLDRGDSINDPNLKNWIGAPVEDALRGFIHYPEHQNLMRKAEAYDTDQQTISEQKGQIKTLQDQLAAKPPSDPNNLTVTPKGWAALFQTIKGFFSKNN